jgi:chromosome segregation ATPase
VTGAASLVGYEDTSGSKKSALAELADLPLSGTAEDQNEAIGRKLEDLLKHSKDGSHFKALVEILVRCSALAANPRTASVSATQFQLQGALFTLQTELKNSCPVLFQELGHFFQAMESHAKELLEQDFQAQLQIKAKHLENTQHLSQVQNQALRERDTTFAQLLRAKEALQHQASYQAQIKKAASLLQQRKLEAELDSQSYELKALKQAHEENLRKLAQLEEERTRTQQSHHIVIQALEKGKTAIILNATQLKKSLKKETGDLNSARYELSQLKKKVLHLEIEIEKGCAEYISSHLQPKDNQIKALSEELQATKAQLAQTVRKPTQDPLATLYKQHGLYASQKKSKTSTHALPSKVSFQPARNTPY